MTSRPQQRPPIRVVLADDAALFREAIAGLLHDSGL